MKQVRTQNKNEWPADHVERRSVDSLIPYARNARTHSEEQVAQLAASIKEWGWTTPVLVDEEGSIIAGHGRVMAARKLGIEEIPVMVARGWTEAQRRAYVLADNKLALNSGWDTELLRVEMRELGDASFDLEKIGFSVGELADLFDEKYSTEDAYSDGVNGSMATNFIQPPFSVLDTRKADWLEKKRYWHSLIKDNGESREGTLADGSIMSEMNNGVSILDPVMAEIVTTWFGTKDGSVFDPFAGDSVFGYVSSYLGMKFSGIELRKEQAELNQKRVNDANLNAIYYNDTSENMDEYIKDCTMDLIFSCPPYADLEVYSNDPRDLSTMKHDVFFDIYAKILKKTFNKLKENRFAVIVMGEVRGKDGAYIGTIPNTIRIMEDAGYKFYNEIILINSAGTLPLRAGKSMRATRKIGKMHQNILVFLKGDVKKAVSDLGPIHLIDGGSGE